MLTTDKQIGLTVQKIVSKIIEVVTPVRVYLFGSAVKNSFTPNSDLDFLVVIPNGIKKRKTSQEIYKKLVDVGFASDIIVITQDEYNEFKDDSNYIIKAAVSEGELVYG